MGLFNLLKKKESSYVSDNNFPKELQQQIQTKQEELDKVLASDDLTPESLGNNHRRYHYKDVNIIVFWQYGGHYGKTCEDIGVRRGDVVDLLPPKNKTDDPEDIAVNWNGIDLGIMKNNRLRSMVHQWKNAGLPVLAIVSQVGGVNKLFIEFAFYGYPKTTNSTKEV